MGLYHRRMGKEESGGLGEKTRKGKGDCSWAAPLSPGCLPKRLVDPYCVTQARRLSENAHKQMVTKNRTLLRKRSTQSIKKRPEKMVTKKKTVLQKQYGSTYLTSVGAYPAIPRAMIPSSSTASDTLMTPSGTRSPSFCCSSLRGQGSPAAIRAHASSTSTASATVTLPSIFTSPGR